MRGHKWALALVLLLALGGILTQPRGREVESLKLVSALAVDGGEEIALTAVTAVRASEDETPEVLAGAGDSLTAAWGKMREGSSRRAYLGQTEQLLIGEGADPAQALDFAVTHRELRMDTLLYLVRGEAGPGLAASAALAAGETGGEDPRGRTIGELLPRLFRGEYVLVPALSAGEDGALIPDGWGALGADGVAGYLEGDAALGAILLSGGGEGLAVTLPGGGAELRAVRCRIGEGAAHCCLTAWVTQGDPNREDLEAWGEEKLRAALAAGWDCWGPESREGETAGVGEWTVEVTGKLVGR